MLHGLFCSCGEWGLLSNCGAWASHCGGFSCGSWALEHRLNTCGTWGLVAPLTCGTFPDQGSLAGWFFTTEPLGKPLLSTLLPMSEIFHNANFFNVLFKSWRTVPSPISESKMASVRLAGTENSFPNHYWERVEFRGHGPAERDEEWDHKVYQAGLSHTPTSPVGSGLIYSDRRPQQLQPQALCLGRKLLVPVDDSTWPEGWQRLSWCFSPLQCQFDLVANYTLCKTGVPPNKANHSVASQIRKRGGWRGTLHVISWIYLLVL